MAAARDGGSGASRAARAAAGGRMEPSQRRGRPGWCRSGGGMAGGDEVSTGWAEEATVAADPAAAGWRRPDLGRLCPGRPGGRWLGGGGELGGGARAGELHVGGSLLVKGICGRPGGVEAGAVRWRQQPEGRAVEGRRRGRGGGEVEGRRYGEAALRQLGSKAAARR